MNIESPLTAVNLSTRSTARIVADGGKRSGSKREKFLIADFQKEILKALLSLPAFLI